MADMRPIHSNGIKSSEAANARPSAPPSTADAVQTRLHRYSGVYDVRAFGAAGNGAAIDSPAINAAISAAAAAGGGVAYLPSGNYVSYSIHLKSNVTLYLDHGARITAADTTMPGNPISSYDAAEPNPAMQWDRYEDFGHNHWHNSLIWGVGLQNIAICGPGMIWGKGLSRGGKHDLPRADTPGVGNKSIALKDCHNVLLRDFSILQGGHFAILATGVDNLVIDHVAIDTNRDGMDIDCCRNVRVTNCSVNSPSDDAICAKSSYALGYARSTENLTISNCYVTGDYEVGSMLNGRLSRFPQSVKIQRQGGIKCGTESNGGFKNIAISNCVFDSCRGLRIESVDGAIVEDICVTNLTMRRVPMTPIFLRLGSRMRGPLGVPIGKMRRILIKDVVCSGADSQFCSVLSGIPDHRIQEIRISNFYIEHRGGGSKQQAALRPPEYAARGPRPNMFGPTPAQGFFLRHLRDLDMSRITIVPASPDARPPFVLDDVIEASFCRIQARQPTTVPVFALRSARAFDVCFSPGLPAMNLDASTNRMIYQAAGRLP